MARDDHQLKFRVPEGLKGRLEAASAGNRRSLNAEIIARLESTFVEMPPPESLAFKTAELLALEKLLLALRAQLKSDIEQSPPAPADDI